MRAKRSPLPAPTMRIGIYEVIELLGDGGMGSVYRCRDARFDRQVAVKVLHPYYQRNPDVVVRFKTEAVVQAKLAHPHIVSVYDFVADDSALAIVMELVDGSSAERLIEIGGPLALDRGIALFEQVLGALGHAHEHGLVHRDVKPSNILIQRAGGPEVAKVVDFGIAKIVGADRQRTATTAKLGTLAYMSPEQVRSPRAADARSDVYSLGATLQQLLTGGLPFEGESDYQVMRAILEAEPAPPLAHGRPLPERVDRAIRKALLRDPAQRFQSCGEFLDALRGGMIELPAAPAVHAPDAPEPAPAARPGTSGAQGEVRRAAPRLRRVLAGIAAAVLGLLLLGGGVAGWFVYRAAAGRAARAEAEARQTEERAADEAHRRREEEATREAGRRRLDQERERRQRELEGRQAEERKKERERIEGARRRQDDARRALEVALHTASADLRQGNLEVARRGFEAAREAVPRDLRADLDSELATVQEHLLDIERRLLEQQTAVRTEEAVAAARRRVFEDQLALARAHFDHARYPEAKSVTDQVLALPDLPADLRAEAESLIAAARQRLQGAWSDAVVGDAVQQKQKPQP